MMINSFLAKKKNKINNQLGISKASSISSRYTQEANYDRCVFIDSGDP